MKDFTVSSADCFRYTRSYECWNRATYCVTPKQMAT